MTSVFRYTFYLIILLLSLLSVLIKCIAINDPFLGAHLFRQLQTLSTIEAYTLDGIHLLKPRTNYVGYPGYLLLELPIFQVAMTWLSDISSYPPLVCTRIANIIIGLLTGGVVFLLSRKFTDRSSAAIAAIVYLFTPLNMMYHWSTLIDPSAVLFSVTATYSYIQLQHGHRRSYLFLFLFLATSLLTVVIKPLYYLPVAALVPIFLISEYLDNEKKNWALRVKETLRKRIGILASIALSGIVMTAWLKISSDYSSAQSVTSHLGWDTLTNPGWYVTILLRYFFYIQTPVGLLFVMILLFHLPKSKSHRIFIWVFIALPFVYYLTFANINYPHDYYSLILPPYSSFAVGYGCFVFLNECKSAKNRFILHSLICAIICMASIFLYLTNYWLSPNVENRYRKIAKEMLPVLETNEYAWVLTDRNGDFQTNEYLAESRRDMIQAKLGTLNTEALREKTRPVYAPAILYAMNRQYGEMWWYDKNPPIDQLNSKKEEYEGNLRYVIFYMATNQKDIVAEMNQGSLIYQSNDFLVFDLRG
ncbi:MAG: glycosyltransferase family 39 protein [Opitutales bacterium]|nr:glycosyltransferase family 39 protein [Opitutales bacterium]